MTTFEEHIENIMMLDGYESVVIEYFDSLKGVLVYWVNGEEFVKTLVRRGYSDWVEQ